jgi:hypothetical protein
MQGFNDSPLLELAVAQMAKPEPVDCMVMAERVHHIPRLGFDFAISGGAVSGTIAQTAAAELSFSGFEANIPIEIHRAGLRRL